MSDQVDPTNTDIRDILLFLGDLFSYFGHSNLKDLEKPEIKALIEKIILFKAGKAPIFLGGKPYTKNDFEYLFYENEE